MIAFRELKDIYKIESIIMTTQLKNSELETVTARANTTALTTPFQHKTIEGKDIPEGFVNSGAEKYDWTIGGRDVQMSGGFMEKSGHGSKSYDTPYLDGWHQDPTKPQIRKAGNYNIGIDYKVGGDKQVTPWYAGTVMMAKDNKDGYGNSVIVKTDYSYKQKGVSYPIYTRYSHLDSINVAQGSQVDPSKSVGKMGGSGSKGRYHYPEHVDFKSYIMVNGKEVQISPNLMQRNLSLQESKGTLYSSSNTSSSVIASDTSTKTAQQINLNSTTSDTANTNTSNSTTADSVENQDGTKSNTDVSKVVTLLKENAAEVKKQYGLDVTTDDGLGKAVMQYWKENNLDPKTLKEQLPTLKDSKTASSVESHNGTDSKAELSKVVALLKNNAAEVKKQSGFDVTTDDGLGRAVMQYWKENNLDPKTLKEQLPNMKESELAAASAALSSTNATETTNTKQVAMQR
jgi:murein DD-endopeptidase MepM/ murein hydrolase activator NlpD